MRRGRRLQQTPAKLFRVRCLRLAAELKLQRCAQERLLQERREKDDL